MVADIAQIGRADAAGKMMGRGYSPWRHIENRDERGAGKASTRSPPTYARAEECARSLYGRRDDEGFGGLAA
jgi:hypothetical protein